MTYFGFLARFLVIPIVILLLLHAWDWRNGRRIPVQLRNYAPWLTLAGMILIAVTYTTPWDNYLVATRVWWYDPALVSGIVFGWVPIEEYTFFVLQPIFTGLWLFWLMKRVVGDGEFRPKPASTPNWALRFVGLLWLASTSLLLSSYERGTYLGLELSWALLPIALQVWFGAGILWHYRRLVLLALVPTTLYLAATDALAIGAGTWTINPEQSLEWLLFGILPIEEFIFFLLTNILVVFGTTLAMVAESHGRLEMLLAKLSAIRPT